LSENHPHTVTNALVSVIIPAFNAENYIEETLKSVVNQTWTHLQIIVVNDGSTDNTEKKTLPFLSDKRIIYVNQQNKGSISARNKGLSLATGDYIQYLDADDVLSLDKISKQITVLKAKTAYEIAICRTKVFSETIGDRDEEISSEFLHDTTDTFAFVLDLYGLKGKPGMIQPNAFLISRELAKSVGPWEQRVAPSYADDDEYFCRVMLRSSAIYFTEGINFYRKLDSKKNLSNQHSYEHAKGALTAFQLKSKNLLFIENSERVKKVIARMFAGFIYLYAQAYPDLSAQAEKTIYALNLRRLPLVGGKRFQNLSMLIGFKNALRIRSLLQSKIRI
jgi:glycosyltransferase involved in cell wall biosynthesis